MNRRELFKTLAGGLVASQLPSPQIATEVQCLAEVQCLTPSAFAEIFIKAALEAYFQSIDEEILNNLYSIPLNP